MELHHNRRTIWEPVVGTCEPRQFKHSPFLYFREKHCIRFSDCLEQTGCKLSQNTKIKKLGHSKDPKRTTKQNSNQDEEPNNLQGTNIRKPDQCWRRDCLLFDTPRVGVFHLRPKSLQESLIGKGEGGQRFKFGKGKVTKGNVNAARTLLSREFPQVASVTQHNTLIRHP